MKKYIYLLLIIVFSQYIAAQSNRGTVNGKVIDHFTGQGIPLATIQIPGTTIGTATDESGNFSISNLAPALYQLKISAVGYKTLLRTDLPVNNSKPTQITIEMTEEIVQLNSVTVSGGYFDKSGTQFTSTTSLGYEEIRRSAGGFEDVIRALSVLPGVAQADAGRNDLIVRGGAPSENLYVLNGMEIPNINHFGTQGANGGPLSFINLDFVKETSFSTGGFSALYGDRLSSVLNIDLRDGRTDKLGGKATISASQFGLNLEGPVSNNSSFIFSARRSYLDFIFKAAGFGFVPEYWDFLGKYDWSIDTQNSLSFVTVHAINGVKYFNSTATQRFDNSRVMGSDQYQYIAGLSFQHLYSQGYIRATLSRNLTDYNTEQKDTSLNPIFKNISLEVENKAKVEIAMKLSKISELTFGGQFSYINFDADVKLPSFYTSFGERLPFDSTKFNTHYIKHGLFASLSNRWSDNFSTITGLRMDYFDGISAKYRFSPRFSATYSPVPLLNLNFSAGKYFQSPSYIWLAVGNQNLLPVQMDQYIAGFDYRLQSDALLKVEAYYKKYSDYPTSSIRPYLVLANTGAGFSGAEDNFSSFGLEPLLSSGKGVAHGIELSVQKKLSEIPCYGILSVTLNKTEFTALDGIERPGSYDQRVIINLSGGYKFSESLEGSMKFRYASGRPYTPFGPGGKQDKTDYNSENLSPMHSLDIRIDKHWFFTSTTLITYIDIQNIYGHRNLTGYKWNSRNQEVEEAKSIGVLPSIGVSLEF
ncbi:MAG: TonB-dependent receptor [Ignavibacteria bacterium]|nr:TonB-dependent receptor [Ignavibacteria bacterium]